MTVGTYCKVLTHDGAYIVTEPHEEPRIDAAVSTWIESNGSRDSVLELDTSDGGTYKLLASTINAWYVSTPEERKAAIQWESDHRAEREAVRQELGIWEADE